MIQEHLAWLDREIAAESRRGGTGHSSGTPSQIPSVPLAVATPAMQVPVSPSAADSEAILAQYQNQPDALKKDVRNGCFLYFALAMLGFFGLVALLYLRTKRVH